MSDHNVALSYFLSLVAHYHVLSSIIRQAVDSHRKKDHCDRGGQDSAILDLPGQASSCRLVLAMYSLWMLMKLVDCAVCAMQSPKQWALGRGELSEKVILGKMGGIGGRRII